jgi:hypothetical protein
VKSLTSSIAIFWIIAAQSFAGDEMKIAVSIRYLQIEGVSHAHIYLYSGDGKLIRQLSNGPAGQDIDPIFAPDGREIVFTRKLKQGEEVWAVDTAGKNLHALNTAPSWYDRKADDTPQFTLLNMEWENWHKNLAKTGSDATPHPSPTLTPEPTRLVAPDNSAELILDRTGDPEKDYDNGELGKLYRFRDLKTGQESLLGTWPGFETMWDPLHLRRHETTYFLIQPPLRTVFFFVHLNSTDGDTVYALDLNRQRVVRLSSNNATPVPLTGYAGFFAVAEERYLPLGDGKRTVNCSYLDRWDAEFKKVRYARSAPAIFGGASVFRPGQPPLNIHSDIEE